jgi:hypothetical protein
MLRITKMVRSNARSIDATNPWSNRGGESNNGSNAGVFASNNNNGGVNNNVSFRPLSVSPFKNYFPYGKQVAR